MLAKTDPTPVLDEAHARFLAEPVAITIAGRNTVNVPSIARAIGCRVSPDRRQVTVFVPVPRAGRVLEDLRAEGTVAVVFALPSTHRSLQLKGVDAKVTPAGEADVALSDAAAAAFARELEPLGYTEAFARIICSTFGEEMAAVTFTPSAVFEQTPGPGAGRRLGA